MAQVKYIGIGKKELLRGRYRWRKDETIEMPARLVLSSVLGHKDLVATFDESDREYITNAPKLQQKSLEKWFKRRSKGVSGNNMQKLRASRSKST